MRVVYGPVASFSRAVASPGYVPPAPPTPLSPAKSDPTPTILGVDDTTEIVKYQIAPYDLATSNHLLKTSPYLVPEGVQVPPDPNVFIDPANGYLFTDCDTSTLFGGGEFDVKLPDGPDGKFNIQTVLFYDV